MMLNDEPQDTGKSTFEVVGPSGADPASQGFAWGYFIAILVGTALIIAIICTIATLSKKQEAAFSFLDTANATSRAA